MSNIQVAELIQGITADKLTKAHLRQLSDAISQLYCHGLISQSSMRSARAKLINYIASKDAAQV